MKPMELDELNGIKWLKSESEYVYNNVMADMLYILITSSAYSPEST